MAELLGQRSSTTCAGRTGDRKLRAFPSRRQSLRAATGSLEEKFPGKRATTLAIPT